MRSDKQELIHRMAADLRRMQIFHSGREAIRALSTGPYRLGDIAVLVDDALAEARQAAVADTMARS